MRTAEVKEAQIRFAVSPQAMEDGPVYAAVKAEHERRLAAMFSHATTVPVWSEPEPEWLVEDEDEPRLVGRFMAGDLAERPPSLYWLTVSQRGVPA